MFRAIIIIIMKKKSKNKNTKWIITVTVLAFIISIGMSLFSEIVLDDVEKLGSLIESVNENKKTNKNPSNNAVFCDNLENLVDTMLFGDKWFFRTLYGKSISFDGNI